jgi:hypothetical protein
MCQYDNEVHRQKNSHIDDDLILVLKQKTHTVKVVTVRQYSKNAYSTVRTSLVRKVSTVRTSAVNNIRTVTTSSVRQIHTVRMLVLQNGYCPLTDSMSYNTRFVSGQVASGQRSQVVSNSKVLV